ncbi:MAG: hypothetical protein OER04_00150 [Cyclobacteriaceae bacterium]|nr:hypothetical protein [Cyclobacteriaceae bacterium]
MWWYRKLLSTIILIIFGVYLIHQSLPHQHHQNLDHHPHDEARPHHHHDQEHHHQEQEHHHHDSYPIGFLGRLLEKHTHSNYPPDDSNFYTAGHKQKIKVKNNIISFALISAPITYSETNSNPAPYKAFFHPMERSCGIRGQRAPPSPFST